MGSQVEARLMDKIKMNPPHRLPPIGGGNNNFSAPQQPQEPGIWTVPQNKNLQAVQYPPPEGFFPGQPLPSQDIPQYPPGYPGYPQPYPGYPQPYPTNSYPGQGYPPPPPTGYPPYGNLPG